MDYEDNDMLEVEVGKIYFGLMDQLGFRYFITQLMLTLFILW